MIMITAIVTIMVTVIISTVARYVTWQLSILGIPLYRYIAFQIMLLAIVLAIFYDRRNGYKRSIEILGYIAHRLKRQSQEGKINATMAMYREHARKFRLRTILLPVAFVLFVAYILSAQMFFFAIVTSGSMEPAFKKGDLVVMQSLLVKPKVGDIIIFPDPKADAVVSRPLTVTHRIVEVAGEDIITQGDNNPYPDQWVVKRKSILGEAIILNERPIVLKDVGKYFLLDFTSQQYTTEFLAISRTIQNLRSMGIMIFFVCLVLYMVLSVRDTRPSRHFKR
ncbi:MAG: signal peptidase I [Candidatus Methanoperedens sp.]|nr:signal peptidase I [Candidatus Methanoperedens sp.]